MRDLERLLDNAQALLAELRSAGIAGLLHRLDDNMLKLAIQPDDSGERARARLMSAIVPALHSETTAQMPGIEEFVRITNVMLPCLLLELGRRKGHIAVDFPADPAAPNASFRISFGSNANLLSAQELVDLVASVGAELVGVCYFGDERDRKGIEEVLVGRRTRSPKYLA